MFTRQSLKLNKFFYVKRNLNGDAQSKVQNNWFQFSEKRKKLPGKGPFLKNIVLNNLDLELFTLPDVHFFDRYKEFEVWIMQINNYVQSIEQNKKLTKNEILSSLVNLDVFKAYISEEYNGLDLLETESLKLTETLSTLPWLGTYLVKNLKLPIEIISKYGSPSQQEKYFPMIMSGEIIPTICLKEKNNGTNINHNKTYATQYDQESWILNGRKEFVFNGTNANFFLVFANTKPGNSINTDNISLFLIEGNSNGITSTETCEVIGRHEIPMCSINFENTIVPSTNILGEPNKAFDIMMDLLKPGNQNIAAQSIAILRNFIKHLIPDILEMKHFDRDYYEFDSVKSVLAEIIYSLYTMESMAYLTSKLIDYYENQDVELERIITEMYCANKCLNSIQSGLQLLGAQIYMDNSFYVDAYHSVLALTTLDTNNLDGEIYVATSLIKHMGTFVYEEVMKSRNTAKYPIFSLLKLCKKQFFEKPIHMNCFHPSLEISTFHLTECIEMTIEGIENLILEHGSQLINNHSDLLRISQMIQEIYALVANLSRASKSYTTGCRNSDIEKDIVISITQSSYFRIEKIYNEIKLKEVANGDRFKKNIADLLYRQRTYPLQHPLHKIY